MNKFQKFLIIFGGFISYMLADGYTYSMGVLYSELMSTFQLSSAETAILPGMIFAVPQFFAPFLCPLLDTYGFSSGSAWGAVLMCAGCCISSFVNNFHTLYLTLGIMTSIGLQLTYLSALMSVTAQFEKSSFFGIAIGITMCGSGVGAFASNYLLAWLLSIWNWREVLLIESAVLLNILVTASCSHHLDAEINTRPPDEQKICFSEDSEDETRCHPNENSTQAFTNVGHFWTTFRFCLCVPSLCRFQRYQPLYGQRNTISTEIEDNEQGIVNGQTVVRKNISVKLQSCACPQFIQASKTNFKQLFSPKLWRNSNFLFYVITNGITGAGVVIPWTFIYDYVLSTLSSLNYRNHIGLVNIDDISWLPSLIGFGLLFGQLFFGLITSQFGDIGTCCENCKEDVSNKDNCCSPTSFKTIMMEKCKATKYRFHLAVFLTVLLLNGVCTLSMAVIPLQSMRSPTKHFALFSHPEGHLLALACFFVGMSNGGLYVIFPQLIIDIVGVELWSSGLGLFLAFNGAMNLCGTNIGGRINDTTGSYQTAFMIAACLPLISFILMISKELITRALCPPKLSVDCDIQPE
uniref:MFS domain-containing protein n=1 Tax=Trichobilharzia regenti TaxID=157069 RepID=A0AA85JH69_TRIRE|nr:unnamed protein product [Trichobilharzia regenti]